MKKRFSLSLLFRLLRVSQYTKNIFIFLPLFFSGSLFDFHGIVNSCIIFISFSCIASSIYILNDIMDQEEDRIHPIKSKRPIANREISLRNALFCVFILAVFSIITALYISFDCLKIIFIYFILNLFYIFWAKHHAIVDITCIALSFVLRTIAGAFAISQNLSQWLILMVFLLCMFLALGKRWDDICLEKNEQVSGNIRTSIKDYSQIFIVATMTFLSTINTVCYIMYTIIPKNQYYTMPEYLYTTTLWVVLGNLRYLQLAFVQENTGSPTHIFLHDKGIQACVFLWVLHLMVLLYL